MNSIVENVLASQIIESNPIATIVIDDRHIVTHWNSAAELLTGVLAEDVIGTSNQWMGFYSVARPIMADMVLFDAAAAKFTDLYEGKFRSSSLRPGSWEGEDFFPQLGFLGKWLYFTAAPIHDASGALIGAIETVQDITEKRHAEDRLRESEETLRRISEIDCLTGLQNRRSFNELLASELSIHRKQEAPLCLILIDIDNFKSINDTHGHPSGDLVLKSLSKVMCACTRKHDTPCRVGGEEFAVIVPQCELEAALALAERIRGRFEQLKIPIDGGEVCCTISLGVSELSSVDDIHSLYKRVDEALYDSKRSGKNKVSVRMECSA